MTRTLVVRNAVAKYDSPRQLRRSAHAASALPAQGERQAVVADTTGRRLVATVSRAGKDKPVTIALRTAEPHA